jgi:hypothetical protein
LIGSWKTSGQIYAGNETTNLSGTDNYELILDGNCILHKADVIMGNEKSETLEIISTGHRADIALMQYFNSKGERGEMTGEITGNEFRIQGKGIKFIGTINNDNTEVTGKWFLQDENKSWIQFIILKLEKQN